MFPHLLEAGSPGGSVTGLASPRVPVLALQIASDTGCVLMSLFFPWGHQSLGVRDHVTSITFIISFKILPPNSGAEAMRDVESNIQISRNTICPVTKSPTDLLPFPTIHRPVGLLPVSGTASHEQRGTSVSSGNFLAGTFLGGGGALVFVLVFSF